MSRHPEHTVGGGASGAVAGHGAAEAGRGGAATDHGAGGVGAGCVGCGADVGGCGPRGEWVSLGEWLFAPAVSLREVDLAVLRDRLGSMGRARAAIAASEAEVISEISRREGDKATEEILCRDQKRSRSRARKAVQMAGQLDWSPDVAGRLADGAITPEAAGLILDAAAETPLDQRALLDAAESEPEDQLRRTIKQMINDATGEQELEARRASQRRRRRASISEQQDGMFGLFAQFDPLTGNRVRAALLAKSDELFRGEDPKDRPTPPQRSADALAELICNSDGQGAPTGAEMIVLADYDAVREQVVNARLADDTPLTEAEALALACDAKILPGIFNKHTGEPLLGRSKRKIPPRLRKQLVARDRGCIGCRATEKICEVHHNKHWCHGGETTLENTCLLCWRCHHIRVHLNGEEVTRRPDGTLTLQPPRTPTNTANRTPREPQPDHPPPNRPPTGDPQADKPRTRSPNRPLAQPPPAPQPPTTRGASGDQSPRQPRLSKSRPPRRAALHAGGTITIACKPKPPPRQSPPTGDPRADKPPADTHRTLPRGPASSGCGSPRWVRSGRTVRESGSSPNIPSGASGTPDRSRNSAPRVERPGAPGTSGLQSFE